MFQKIITITLNPALDATLWVDRFDLAEPVKSFKEKIYPGGKAINVSRVLASLGIKNKSLGIIGQENSFQLKKLLDEENVEYDYIETNGSIRENLSIVLPEGDLFKINRQGFNVSNEVIEKLCKKIENEIDGYESVLIVFAGSLPKNISSKNYMDLILKFSLKNTKICIDTDVFTIEDLKKIKPFAIKPNIVELSKISNCKFDSIDKVKEYANYMTDFVENVLVSMGDDGLIYAGKGQSIYQPSPKVLVKSTVGAGDTTLAGFLAYISKNKPIEECVLYACACGTASVLLDGTDVIAKQNVEDILKIIRQNL